MKDEKINRLLITGGTGFIGKYVVKALKDKYKIRIFTRKDFSFSGAEVFIGNLLDKQDVVSASKDVDCIIHLAAIIQGNEKNIYDFNVNSTKLLVDQANKKKIKFVFLSSENTMWEGQSAYGNSKKECEKLVGKIQDSAILRCAVVYGKENKISLGKVMDIVKKWPIIFVPGNGKSLMQPIFVEDVAKYIENALKYDVTGVYVIAGASRISMNHFIDAIAKLLGVRIIKIHLPLWVLHPLIAGLEIIMKHPPIKWSQLKNLNTDRVYDITNTIKIFGHKPAELKEGLKKTLFSKD